MCRSNALFWASAFWLATMCVSLGILSVLAGPRCGESVTWSAYLILVTSYPAYLFHVGVYLTVLFGSVALYNILREE